ncbi:unnamed protein product [Alopecurus aequalis]
MPSQQIPAAPVVGGVTSRRHAKLLHHLFEGNGGGAPVNAPVKDLRIRRVVPPASAPPPDSSPDCAAAAVKPLPAVQIPAQAQAQSTPPEPSAAAAAEDRERKPILPRSKLVRDPASFGYRRLLPFLNQMAAKNGSGISDCKETPSETKVSLPIKEASRSVPGLAGESVDGSQGGAAPVDPAEPIAVEAAGDREVKDCSDDTVTEAAAKVAPADPASSKPVPPPRCARSKFVHHPGSFSYKRMLPFLMENEISSQGEDRAKIRRVSEEERIASDESNVLASGRLAVSKGSSEEHNGAEVDRVVEEVQSISAEVQEVTQEVLVSVADPLSSEKGGLTLGMIAVPAGGQSQLAVSEDSLEERDVAVAETTVEEREASKVDEKSVLIDPVELLVVKAGGDQDMKELHGTATEQIKPVPVDLASSKLCLTRCPRSRLVHQRNSFSYKRMLPFLMENQISSQEGDRAKLQIIPEEKQLALEKSPVIASVPEISVDSAEASYRAEVERIVKEIASAPHQDYLLDGGRVQSAVAEVSLDGSTAEVQKVSPEVVSSLGKDELASVVDGVLAGAQCQLAVPEDSPKESNVTEAEEIAVEEKTVKSDENSVDLQSAVSEVSPQDGVAQKNGTGKPVLVSDGDQPQLCDSKKLLQGNAEVAEVQECQSSESGCPDTVTVDGGADQQGAQETQVSVASPDALLLDVGMICKPSDPCFEKQFLSPKKLSPVNGALSLKKRFLSPKKGILKRHTNGCKGICMCLDCSVFRLRADRAFEFSRKQMQVADDIIENLLEEVTSLRSVAEKSSGQAQIEKACERASRVEEVARERRRQMQVELNAHCKIPGPRVKFAQYVEEKMAASSPRRGNIRRQPSL